MFLCRHGTSVYTVLTLRTVLSLIHSLVLEDFDFCNWAEDVTPVSIGSALKSPWPSFWRLWGSTVSWVANRKQSDGHLWKTALCYRKIVILKNKYTCVKTRLVGYMAVTVPQANQEAQKVRGTIKVVIQSWWHPCKNFTGVCCERAFELQERFGF